MKQTSCLAFEFSAGEPVPSWLIDADPSGPVSTRGRMTFGADVLVVQRPADSAWVIVQAAGGEMFSPAIRIDAGDHLTVFAATEDVMFPNGVTYMVGRAPARSLTGEWKP
jgi:hypothetical protein